MLNTTRVVGLFALLFVAAGARLLAADLGIVTGTWEFKMTGFPMDGVPAAMKAQIEAEMSKPYRSCVTSDDIKKLKFGKTNDDDDEDCKIVSSKLTQTGGDVVRQCDGDEPSTQNLHVDAPNPQTIKATMTKKTGAKTTTMTVAGRWLSARCSE